MVIPDYECAYCKFWLGHFESGYASVGECRRFPPSIPASEGHERYWPIVGVKDWCGEFIVSEEHAFNDPVTGVALRDPMTGQKLPKS